MSRGNFGKLIFVLFSLLLSSSLFAYTLDDLKEDNKDYFNFDLQLDTNEIFIQVQSTDKVYLNIDLENNKKINFTTSVEDHPNITCVTNNNITTVSDFQTVLHINTFNPNIGTYPLLVKVTGQSGTRIIEKNITLYVTIIEKQNFNFNTVAHSQKDSSLENIILSQNNFFIAPGETDNFSVKLTNTGSNSNFKIDYYPKIAGIDLNFSHDRFNTIQGIETTVYGALSIDLNYDKDLTGLFLYVYDSSTGVKYDLGKLNIQLARAKLIIHEEHSSEDINMIIENQGTIAGELIVTAGDSEFLAYVPANSKKEYNLPKQDILIKNLDDETVEEFNFDNNIPQISAVSGLFSLGGSNSGILWGGIALLVALLLYKILFSNGGLLNNATSVKKLNIKA